MNTNSGMIHIFGVEINRYYETMPVLNKKTLKKIFILFLSCFMTTYSPAQIKEAKAIDRIFSQWDTDNSPGCALGIMKDGQLIYAKGYGMANLEYAIPVSPSSVFRIGSTSKQFTAACIILLAEQGKLNLDKTLKEIYPEFPDYAKKITIRHLLNHTSGIRDYLQLAYLKGLGNHDFYQDKDIMLWLTNQKELNFNPGDEFLYSNSGYWLLGQIVQEVSGMNMADFAKKEIFDPLRMSNTHFHNDHTRIVKNRASGYLPDNNDGYKISMTTLDMIGDGGIFTTINDINIWDQAYYNSDVLSEKFWEMMTEQGVLNNGENIKYAAGLFIDEYKGLKTISHGGAFVGFRAEFIKFPEKHFSVAVFANRGDANPTKMAYQVADIMLKNKLKENASDKKSTDNEPDTNVSAFKPEQMVGSYEVQPGVVVKITIKNNILNVFQEWNKTSYQITRTKGNTFKIPGDEGIRFTFSALEDGFTQQLDVLQNGIITTAKRKKAVDASNINLEDYAGSYYCKELDVHYHFVIENDMLQVSIKNNNKLECRISRIDEFSTEFGLLRFKRNGNAVNGFELDSGRVKHLWFEKQ